MISEMPKNPWSYVEGDDPSRWFVRLVIAVGGVVLLILWLNGNIHLAFGMEMNP